MNQNQNGHRYLLRTHTFWNNTFGIGYLKLASWVTKIVKSLPAMQETQVRSLGREGPLEKGMASNSNILAWRIPWTEEPGGLQAMGVAKSWT